MEKALKNKCEAVVKALSQKGLTVATAESCTGGLISSLITSVSGASAVFGLGICSYSPEAKNQVLRVSAETLKEYGTVSEFTASEMAQNVRLIANADIGLSVTGVAGPSPSENKPVGLVYIALSGKNQTTVKKLNIENLGRDFIRSTAAVEVFNLLINYLQLEED
ncbi:MAG: CinA family protein [Ruminococcaceae bacterium]|nr:CinA family protein [Oscillospiraceae bacterium]